MNPLSLKIINPELSEKFDKAMIEKAFNSQYCALIVLFFSFATSMILLLAREIESKHSAKYLLYAYVLQLFPYISIILLSRKSIFMKRYGSMIMIFLYNTISCEYFNYIEEPNMFFFRYFFIFHRILSFSVLSIYCFSVVTLSFIPSLILLVLYYAYPIVRNYSIV